MGGLRRLRVELEVAERGGRSGFVRDAAVRVELHERRDVGVEQHVDFAVLKRDHLRVDVGHDAEHDVGDDRLLAPVELVGGQRDVVAGHILHILVGAGADGIGVVAVLAYGLKMGLGEDQRVAVAQRVDEAAEGAGELDDNGLVVDLLAGVVVEQLGLAGAGGADGVHREHHVVYGHVRAIGELDALTDLQRVGKTVIADAPLGGQQALVGAVGVALDQGIIDVVQDRNLVHVRPIGAVADEERVRLCGRRDSYLGLCRFRLNHGHGPQQHHERQ